MRVVLDTNPLHTTQAGVARYVRGLLRGLAQIEEPHAEIIPLAWGVDNFAYHQPQRALKTVYRELIWANFIAPWVLRSQNAELLHSTSGLIRQPPRLLKHVVTLYDLALLRHPERFRHWHRIIGRQRLAHVAKADRVLAISRFTADEAMKVLDLPARLLEVVYIGCDFHADEPAPAERKPDAKVPSDFFLFVGSLEPGKNLSLLKEAYRMAEAQGHSLPALVIVGARWEGVATEGAPPNNWYYLGRQPDAALVWLYRRAVGLVFPSKYEGFGLPVAEAMALGCPVVCSPVASLSEVAGDAALFAELTPVSYEQALQRLTRDQALRSELKVRGLAQAGKFSWRKCAQETVEVYRAVLDG